MTAQVANGGAFLHIPKTGGVWVQKVLERNGLFGGGIGIEHGAWHAERWAFCVVREPVQWWLSCWRYRCETDFVGLPSHPLSPISHIAEPEAAIFFHRVLREAPGFCGNLYRQYLPYAKYVLTTENLKAQLRALGEIVHWPELDLELPPQNTTEPRPYDGAELEALAASEFEAYHIWRKSGLIPMIAYEI